MGESPIRARGPIADADAVEWLRTGEVRVLGRLPWSSNATFLVDVGPGDEPRDGPGDGPGDEPGDGPGDEPGDGPGDGPGDEPGDGPGNEPILQAV